MIKNNQFLAISLLISILCIHGLLMVTNCPDDPYIKPNPISDEAIQQVKSWSENKLIDKINGQIQAEANWFRHFSKAAKQYQLDYYSTVYDQIGYDFQVNGNFMLNMVLNGSYTQKDRHLLLEHLTLFHRYWLRYIDEKMQLLRRCPQLLTNLPVGSNTVDNLMRQLAITQNNTVEALDNYIKGYKSDNRGSEITVIVTAVILDYVQKNIPIIDKNIDQLQPESVKAKTMHWFIMDLEFLLRGYRVLNV
ncbi:uncharacterized protein LOC128953249 [Oppia nitens]|uniref:uncharacterized protein LOC128953249 n=1 Tax=Oppia nitens TaxID=1686743 RepID=UPI0023DCC4BF|nr:uncharacterized protein LOC128953249 [Oppia nitens]